ncbi:MAG: GlsB/YeaQ/YmgE family stress response membrane protein [Arcanobacterium sp.]|nr:GlsB/YeaQ/YmgE family stress response membrane protein [Arcanobacterium sp.]
MGFIAFIILGLVSGSIAKKLSPESTKGGWFSTLILGVIGANFGGWLGSKLFNVGLSNFWSIQTWALAIIGSLIVLGIWGFVTGRKNK